MALLSPEVKSRLLDNLKDMVGQQHFERWFQSIDLIDDGQNTIEIPLPNVYYCQWYERNYGTLIQKALETTLGGSYKVRFSVSANSNGPTGADGQMPLFGVGPQAEGETPGESKPVVPTTVETKETPRCELGLNRNFTFDRFIVGSCNRFAHAAALAVAENPGKAYNPVFIHGSVGLGKTHLLQAICHTVLDRNPKTDICYRSCEGFVNDYIAAIQAGKLEQFRNRYRQIDILVIDDIHFLGKGDKPASQEEFFHTFNALHNSQRQIILSSDSPPQNIPNLIDRLVSRFKWGVVARLDAPDFETSAAILRSKATLGGTDVPDEAISFLATNISTNVRDLEGAINTVIGLSRATHRPIDVTLAKEAIKDIVKIGAYPITFETVQKAVSGHFNLTPSDLQSKKRDRTITTARQIGIYLARLLNPYYSLEEIGNAFGGRDHSTVLYAIEKVKQRISKDKQFAATMDILVNELKKSVA